MNPDATTPRKLNERTEKHKCIKCLREVPSEEYFSNDFLCNECAEKDQKDEVRRMKDE